MPWNIAQHDLHHQKIATTFIFGPLLLARTTLGSALDSNRMYKSVMLNVKLFETPPQRRPASKLVQDVYLGA